MHNALYNILQFMHAYYIQYMYSRNCRYFRTIKFSYTLSFILIDYFVGEFSGSLDLKPMHIR